MWRINTGFTVSAGVGVGEGLILVGGMKVNWPHFPWMETVMENKGVQ